MVQRRHLNRDATPSLGRSASAQRRAERTSGSDRRTLILKAAGELFSHNGFPNVSIDDIGRDAGVTGPAVYRHFSTKSLILEALFDEMIQSLDAKLSEFLPIENPSVEDYVAAFVSFALATGNRIKLWDQEGRYLSRTAVTRIMASQLNYVTSVAAAIEQQYGVPRPDAAWLVKGLVGMIHAMAARGKVSSPEQELELRGAAMGAISGFATANQGGSAVRCNFAVNRVLGEISS